MFRESLLESSNNKKRKRWPMALAFAGEIAVATLLVVIPLLTTAVIRVSAHVGPIVPLGEIRVAHDPQRSGDPTPSGPPHRAAVNFLQPNGHRIDGFSKPTVDDCCDPRPPNIGDPQGVNLSIGDQLPPPTRPPVMRRLRVSELAAAYLIHKVEPIYPHMAVVTHTQGDVKLHAIIAKDGTIESLSVISGHPMLVPAAVDAVKQWRYRPYILNGEPVEVETFVTVSFKGIRD